MPGWLRPTVLLCKADFGFYAVGYLKKPKFSTFTKITSYGYTMVGLHLPILKEAVAHAAHFQNIIKQVVAEVRSF